MVPFAIAAVIGLATVVLPGPEIDGDLYALACGITLVLIAAGVWLARGDGPRWLVLAIPLGFFVMLAVLRHSQQVANGGYQPLVVLPVVWLALFGDRRQLLIGLAALALTLLVP